MIDIGHVSRNMLSWLARSRTFDVFAGSQIIDAVAGPRDQIGDAQAPFGKPDPFDVNDVHSASSLDGIGF